ncbi:MAG: PE-PGRS family protein, partial [Pseudomonadota bacterium]
LKGNSKDGLIERNLVICERFHSGQTRLGLSFGGGGTSLDSICEDMTCTPEHENGLMRNNIIVNCPSDVGIYLNEAASSEVHHNTLFNTTGIDVRFSASSVDLRNNLLGGEIRNRDGGQSTEGSNFEQVSVDDFQAWFASPAAADFTRVDGSSFVDLGEVVPAVADDYCATLRDAMPDIGAVEYISGTLCDTTVPGGSDLVFRNGFES